MAKLHEEKKYVRKSRNYSDRVRCMLAVLAFVPPQ